MITNRDHRTPHMNGVTPCHGPLKARLVRDAPTVDCDFLFITGPRLFQRCRTSARQPAGMFHRSLKIVRDWPTGQQASAPQESNAE